MRKWLTLALLAGFCLTLTSPVLAGPPKSLVVLSLSSYDQAKSDTSSVGFVGKSPEMPTWLAGLFKLYSEGQPLAGLDHSRPWGAVIQIDDRLSAYAFVPVTDAETLLSELYEHVADATDIGGGMYHVVGTDSTKELYAKLVGNWLFVAPSTRCLANVPQQPTGLLDGLNQKYDVAVRLVASNIPAERGQKILAQLDKTLGSALRQASSEATVTILGQAAASMDDVTMGWSRH